MRLRLFAFALALAGCAPAVPASAPARTDADRRALLAVDRAFSARSVEKGSDVAFTEYAADDATMLPMGGAPLVGKAAIVKSFAAAPWDGESQLRWEPVAADASGDLGYTWGTFVSTRGKGGARVASSPRQIEPSGPKAGGMEDVSRRLKLNFAWVDAQRGVPSEVSACAVAAVLE